MIRYQLRYDSTSAATVFDDSRILYEAASYYSIYCCVCREEIESSSGYVEEKTFK